MYYYLLLASFIIMPGLAMENTPLKESVFSAFLQEYGTNKIKSKIHKNTDATLTVSYEKALFNIHLMDTPLLPHVEPLEKARQKHYLSSHFPLDSKGKATLEPSTTLSVSLTDTNVITCTFTSMYTAEELKNLANAHHMDL